MDSDQRKSFRILAPTGQDHAVLKVGGRSRTVRIVDSSAGGFALATREALAVKSGDVLPLRTNSGWHSVRVVRHESFSDGMLMGVQLLGDIDDPRQLAILSGTRFGYTFVTRVFTAGAVAAAIVAGLAWLVAHDRRCQPEAKILPRAADHVITTLADQVRKVADTVRSDSPAP